MKINSWHKKDIANTANSAPHSMEIMKAYMDYIVLHGDKTGAAIYSISDLESNTVTMYFSPEASELAAAFEATPCEKPEASSRLGTFVGHSKNGRSHFWSE